jgi:hypothetical protein
LLDVEHPQVALRLVVVDQDRQVVKEGQHLVLAEPQALREVAHRRLFHLSALAGPSLGRWIGRMPCGEQRAEWVTNASRAAVGRWREPARRACSTAALISRNRSFSSLAQVCWYCSSK